MSAKTNKVNSLVMAYYNTTAPATTALNLTATSRVVGAAGAARSAARVYNTILVSKGTAIGKAISLLQRTGVSLRHLGLPCRTGGFYLPVRDIEKAQNIYDDAQVELADVRDDIIRTFPDMIEPLKKALGSFINEVTIPTATEVASRFAMSLTITNTHAALDNSVLSGVAKEVANRVKAESQSQIDDLLKQAHSGPVADLRSTLEEFADALRNAKRLHLTRFDKLRDQVKRVKGLNVMGLPEIDALLNATAQIAAAGVGGVSDSDRTELANKAESVVKQADDTLGALGL